MVKITVHEDCGNAPKKLFLRDFVISVVKNDSEHIFHNIIDDVQWNFIGGRRIDGKQDVLTELKRSRGSKIVELIINTIVTHGYNGVVDGLLKFKGGKTIAFCDIYEFRASTNNAPIKTITTYEIALE